MPTSLGLPTMSNRKSGFRSLSTITTRRAGTDALTSAAPMSLNILVVEDDPSSRAALEKLLRQDQIEVDSCGTLVEAAARVDETA